MERVAARDHVELPQAGAVSGGARGRAQCESDTGTVRPHDIVSQSVGALGEGQNVQEEDLVEPEERSCVGSWEGPKDLPRKNGSSTW